MTRSGQKRDYVADLGGLGDPKFSYLKGTTTPEPARLLLDALGEPELDSRVAESLSWLALTYVDIDWDWLTQNAKLRRRQNRLDFVISLASKLAQRKHESARASMLRHWLEVLEMARLSEEDW